MNQPWTLALYVYGMQAHPVPEDLLPGIGALLKPTVQRCWHWIPENWPLASYVVEERIERWNACINPDFQVAARYLDVDGEDLRQDWLTKARREMPASDPTHGRLVIADPAGEILEQTELSSVIPATLVDQLAPDLDLRELELELARCVTLENRVSILEPMDGTQLSLRPRLYRKNSDGALHVWSRKNRAVNAPAAFDGLKRDGNTATITKSGP